jgi:RHS repeat-associated protein
MSDGAGTWQYSLASFQDPSWQVLGGGAPLSGLFPVNTQAVVTDPANNQRTVKLFWSDPVPADLRNGRVTDDTDALGHNTHIDYDGYARITKITHPAGNYESYLYDARSNVLQMTKAPAPGTPPMPNWQTSPASIVISATYPEPAGGCVNPYVCNKPLTTTDERGNVTSYCYKTTDSGGQCDTNASSTGHIVEMDVTKPPGANGVQPVTRYTYSWIPTYVPNGAGGWTWNGAIWVLMGVSECANTADSASNAVSACHNTADESRTTYVYASSNYSGTTRCNPQAGDGSCNAWPYQVIKSAGDGSVSTTTTMTYDVFGNVQTTTDALKNSTTYLYDADRRKVGEIDPLLRAVRTTYTPDGLVSLVEKGTVGAATTSWSAFNASFSPAEQLATAYDTADRKIQDSVNSGGVTLKTTQYGYNNADLLSCTAERMNPSVFGSLPSDACALGTAGAYGQDRITKTLYDAVNRPTQIIKGLGSTNAQGASTQINYDTIQSYTANGLKLSESDANGNLTSYTYDGYDRLALINYPSPTNAGSSNPNDYEQYNYDAASNLTFDRRRDGVWICQSGCSDYGLVYDSLNRKTVDLNGASLTYDNLGRRLTASLGGVTTTFTYDALGDKLSESAPSSSGNPTTFAYDADLRLQTITWPDSFAVTYGYDASSELTTITQGSNLLLTYGYDALGRRSTITRANGVTTSYGYDPAWRLSSLSHSLPGSASQAYTLAYNPADQIISNTSANSLYWWTGAVAATRGYTNNGLNQLATLTSSLNAGPFTLSYTDNNARSRGNLTSDGTNSYVYDETNHMISMSNGTTLAYDGLGRLYETVANQPTLTYDVFGQAYQTSQTAPTFFAYDDDKVIGEYDQNGNLQQRYIHGPGTDEPVVWYPVSTGNTPQWLLADHQGSIIAVTGSSGALLNGGQPNTYDEYGVPGGANYGRFQYTGQMWIPELGVYSYKARMYSPTLGRFFQTDPAGYKDDLDWYAYVGDDPVDKDDPTGNDGDCPDTQKIGGWVHCYGGSDGGSFRSADNADFKTQKANYNAERKADQPEDDKQLFDGAKAIITTGLAGAAVEFGLGAVAGASKVGKVLEAVCGCFVAGTLVETDHGMRPIEQIKVGDRVQSRDVATGVTEFKAVTALIRPHGKHLYKVQLKQAETGLVETFEVTDDHPWMSANGRWLTTVQLRAGAKIQTEDHRDVQVVSVTKTNLTADTYNLDVADFHTYFVGKERVWVHNACTPGQLAQYTKQLETAGRQSLLRSQASLQGRLAEHEAKLAQYLKEGGYTSSVEKEIRNFKGELDAIKRVLGQ